MLFKWVIDAGQDTDYVVVLSSIAITCLLWIVVALLIQARTRGKAAEFLQGSSTHGLVGPHRRKGRHALYRRRTHRSRPGNGPPGAVAVGGGIVGLSGLYVGRWEVALTGGLLALVLGLWFKRTYATVAGQS